MTFKIIESQTLVKGRVFDVLRERIRFPDGREANFDVLHSGNAVGILPVNNEKEIVFVKQYRPAVGRHLIEIPAGRIDSGENPEQTATRELQEEIGRLPGKLHRLQSVHIAPGVLNEQITLFLATDLAPSSLPQDEDEEIEIISMPLEEVFERISSGEITDAKTILALHLAMPLLSSP